MTSNVAEILVFSTGGTFNKIYDPIEGQLKVDGGIRAMESIASRWLCDLEYREIIGKDSVEMDDTDRKILFEAVIEAPQKRIVVIHGTDTMDRSASYVASRLADRLVVFTGAMVPYSIDPVEATANFALALGFALESERRGVFLAMHGQIGTPQTLRKNRKLGRFESP